MAIEYFPCYHSYLARLAKLSDQEVGRLFRALLTYSATGECPELTGRESVAFDFVKFDIDQAHENCKTKSQKRSEAATMRWNANDANDANGCKRMQTDANGRTTKAKAKANITPELPNGSSAPLPGANTPKKFAPPSVDDVAAYCQERKNNVDPQRFVDYYTSNGWKVGKNPMKDWKAALRTWEKGRKADGNSPGNPQAERVGHYL